MKRLLILSSAILLPACASLPQRTESLPSIPSAFVAEGSAESPQHWWAHWPELDGLITQAFADNPGLAATRARLDAAEASLRSQRSSLFPNLNLSAQHSEGFLDSSAADAQSLSLAAAYEVDLWGRVRSAARSADFSLKASEQDVHTAAISLASSVASLWFQIGTARERLQLIENDRHNYEKTLNLIEVRYRQGQASASDVMRQRQLLESTRSDEAGAHASLEVLRNALGEVLGGAWTAPNSSPWNGAEGNWDLPPMPQTGIPSETVLRRPDVQQAWLEVQAADQNVAAAIAARFPRLDLSVSASTTNAGLVDLLDEWIGSFVASLVGPIVDGGSRRAAVASQQAVLEQRLAEFQQAVLAAFREIQDALVQEQSLSEQLASLTEQQHLSEAAVQSQLVQLRYGTTDFPSLLDSQNSFSGVRRNWLSTRQSLIDNRITLYRALAGPLNEAVLEAVRNNQPDQARNPTATSNVKLSPVNS